MIVYFWDFLPSSVFSVERLLSSFEEWACVKNTYGHGHVMKCEWVAVAGAINDDYVCIMHLLRSKNKGNSIEKVITNCNTSCLWKSDITMQCICNHLSSFLLVGVCMYACGWFEV